MPDAPAPVSGAATAPTPLEIFNRSIAAAMGCVTNFKWDSADFDLAQLKAAGAKLPPEEAVLADAFVEPVEQFVIGNRLLATAKDDTERAAALEHLKAAQTAVRERRLRLSEVAGNPGYFQFALGIESQVYSLQARLARGRGDAVEAAQWQARIEQVFDEMLGTLAENDAQRCYLLACRKIPLGVNRLERGMSAAGEMNLDQARAYLAEAVAAFEEIRALYAKVTDRSGIVQGMVRLGHGFQLYSGALDSYIDALHTAVVGDLSRGQLTRLEQAERDALEGAEEITRSFATMPGFFVQADLRQSGQTLATHARNLRALGVRSLSPKAITRSASPRALVYFLGTSLVLFFALPFSGLVQKLDLSGVAFVLATSLVIALISAFGFESTRLLPWFTALAKFVPGGGKDDAKSAD